MAPDSSFLLMTSWEAAGDGLGGLVPDSHLGDPDDTPGSGLSLAQPQLFWALEE